MNNLTTFYIVRHGQSRANAGEYKTANDVIESPLSELGKEQAKILKEKLKDVHFDEIFSSDLARAKETAEIIALERNIEVKTSYRIRERSYHEHRLTSKYGENENEFLKAFREGLKDLDEKGKMQFKLDPDSESAEEGAIRLLNFIREIAVAYSGKTILIICHGNIMRSLLTHLGFVKFDHLPAGSIRNTGYFTLRTDGSEIIVGETDGVNIQEGALRDF